MLSGTTCSATAALLLLPLCWLVPPVFALLLLPQGSVGETNDSGMVICRAAVKKYCSVPTTTVPLNLHPGREGVVSTV